MIKPTEAILCEDELSDLVGEVLEGGTEKVESEEWSVNPDGPYISSSRESVVPTLLTRTVEIDVTSCSHVSGYCTGISWFEGRPLRWEARRVSTLDNISTFEIFEVIL